MSSYGINSAGGTKGQLRGSLVLFSLSFLWLILPDVITIGSDVHGYAIDVIRGTIPSDWGSLLFHYELRYLTEIVHALVPWDWWKSLVDFCMQHAPQSFDERMLRSMGESLDLFPAFGAINLLWVACTGMLYAALLWLFRELASRDKAYIVSIIAFSLFLLFVRHYHYFYFQKYVDSYFTCFSLTSVIALYAAHRAKGKKRLLLYACFFVLLLHAVMYRKNACLILPAALYYFILSWRSGLSVTKRWIGTAVASLALFLVAWGIQKVLPSTPTYPACVLMMSDIKNTAFFCGDRRVVEVVEENTGLYCRDEGKICPDYSTTRCRDLDEKGWATLKEAYMGLVMEHPKEWALSRGVQLVQFVFNGYVPRPVRRAVEALCPKANLTEEEWGWQPLPEASSGGRYEKILLGLLLAGSLLYGWKKPCCLPYQLANCFAWVGLAYLMSFVLMTPTPDARFHALFVMSAGLCICLYLGGAVRQGLRVCRRGERREAEEGENMPQA